MGVPNNHQSMMGNLESLPLSRLEGRVLKDNLLRSQMAATARWLNPVALAISAFRNPWRYKRLTSPLRKLISFRRLVRSVCRAVSTRTPSRPVYMERGPESSPKGWEVAEIRQLLPSRPKKFLFWA